MLFPKITAGVGSSWIAGFRWDETNSGFWLAGRCSKCIGKEFIFGEAAQPGEIPVGGFHHCRGATRIYLIPAEIIEILQHGLMHQPGPSTPVIRGRGLGKHRDKGKIVMLLLPASSQFRHITIRAGAVTPVEHHLPLAVEVPPM